MRGETLRALGVKQTEEVVKRQLLWGEAEAEALPGPQPAPEGRAVADVERSLCVQEHVQEKTI